MTRREAAMILGIRESAPEDKVKEAHRRIMIANHPDSGMLGCLLQHTMHMHWHMFHLHMCWAWVVGMGGGRGHTCCERICQGKVHTCWVLCAVHRVPTTICVPLAQHMHMKHHACAHVLNRWQWVHCNQGQRGKGLAAGEEAQWWLCILSIPREWRTVPV